MENNYLKSFRVSSVQGSKLIIRDTSAEYFCSLSFKGKLLEVEDCEFSSNTDIDCEIDTIYTSVITTAARLINVKYISNSNIAHSQLNDINKVENMSIVNCNILKSLYILSYNYFVIKNVDIKYSTINCRNSKTDSTPLRNGKLINSKLCGRIYHEDDFYIANLLVVNQKVTKYLKFNKNELL